MLVFAVLASVGIGCVTYFILSGIGPPGAVSTLSFRLPNRPVVVGAVPLSKREARALQTLAHRLARVNLNWTVHQFFLVVAVAGAFGLALGLELQNGFLAAMLAIAFGGLPFEYLRSRELRRQQLISDAIGPTLDQMARLHTIHQHPQKVIEEAAKTAPEPLRSEFEAVVDECRAGGDLKQAVIRMANRVHNLYIYQVSQMIVNSLETGANLSDGIALVVENHRNAVVLNRERRATTQMYRTFMNVCVWVMIGTLALLPILSPRSLRYFVTVPLGRTAMAWVVTTTILAVWLPRRLLVGEDIE